MLEALGDAGLSNPALTNPALTSPTGEVPGLTAPGLSTPGLTTPSAGLDPTMTPISAGALPVPGEVPISAPLATDPTLGTYPILGDPLYPEVAAPVPAGDFRRPLQLLARRLEFTDPVTGVEHRFTSGRTLAAWSSYEDWTAGQ